MKKPDTSRPRAQQNQSSSLKDKIGEGLEKLGHKLSEVGAPTIGQKIHDLGDRLETKHTNPGHPHKA